MLLDKLDPSMLSDIKDRREDGTLAIAAGSLVVLGIVLGAVAIYDKVMESRTESKVE